MLFVLFFSAYGQPTCPVWKWEALASNVCTQYSGEKILLNQDGCGDNFCYASGVSAWYSSSPDEGDEYKCTDQSTTSGVTDST